MASRWTNLPYSEYEQIYMAQTTATTTPLPTIADIRKNVGALIRQEIAESDQTLCYYENLAGDSPIPYLCEIGCCTHGCCGLVEVSQPNALPNIGFVEFQYCYFIRSSKYGWAVGLLIVFLLAVLCASLAMFALYLVNRQKDARLRHRFTANSADGSTIISQVLSPPNCAYIILQTQATHASCAFTRLSTAL
uniref:CX domain-containing protein n=1 Tax=Ascaris lumbricoides TaxID=6252 RepID=A0A0M3IBI2_ASCLU